MTVASLELIDFSGMTATERNTFLGLLQTQGIDEVTLRLPAHSDSIDDGLLSNTWRDATLNMVTSAQAYGIACNVDLHTWYTTWDSYYDDNASNETTYRGRHLSYINDAIPKLDVTNVNAFMVLNEPQYQSSAASDSENNFILSCISTAKALTSKPVSVRFMGGFSPSTTPGYAASIDDATDFLCRNVYWDPRSPGTSVNGITEAKMNAMIARAVSLGKELWITEFGKTSTGTTAQNEAQRAYVAAWLTYAKSKSIAKIFCWAASPDVTGEDYDIFSGYTPRPAFYELDNDTGIYTLTVDIVGPASCTVSKSPSKATYDSGDVVTLTASAGTDYVFYGWEGAGLSGRATSNTVTVTGNTTVKAIFAYVVGGYPAAKSAEQYGLYLYDPLNASNIYSTNVFIHGPNLADYPVLRVAGTETVKLMFTGITCSSVIIDDDYYGATTDRGQIFGIRGSVATFAAIILDGSGNSITNCRLKRCIRYGFTTFGCNNFYIGYNIAEEAQYCISGSGATSSNGIIEYNQGLSSGYTVSLKIKNWNNVLVRRNTFEVTPYYSGIPGRGLNFSGDDPANNVDVIVEYNTFIRSYAGNYPALSVVAISVDATGSLAGNAIRYNTFINLPGGYVMSSSCSGNDIGIYGNIFYNASELVDLGTGNTISNTYRTGNYVPLKSVGLRMGTGLMCLNNGLVMRR